MENSTKYFNDYDIYESKSCFFKQGVDTLNQSASDIKLEQPFFTEDDFKPDQPEEVVKTLDELIFLYSTINTQPQPQVQPRQSPAQLQHQSTFLRKRKPFQSEYYSSDYLDEKAKFYTELKRQEESRIKKLVIENVY